MKSESLFRNIAKFIISQLSKFFFKNVLITIEHGHLCITKGTYVKILMLPVPETGNEYADCREYDPTKIMECFLDLYQSSETRFQHGGSVIDQQIGMLDISANCLMVRTSK